MGAPVGNQNARKAREWTDALRWQLENYEGSGIARGQALRSIAQAVIQKALEGDKDAWREIGDRLEGKAVATTEIAATLDATVRAGLAPIYGLQPPSET